MFVLLFVLMLLLLLVLLLVVMEGERRREMAMGLTLVVEVVMLARACGVDGNHEIAWEGGRWRNLGVICKQKMEEQKRRTVTIRGR